MFAYDAEITEPCAHTTSTLTRKRPAASPPNGWSRNSVVKGNIVILTGVPGTSVDDQRTKAAKAVFAKYPNIKIVGEAVGMWSRAVARTELSKILTTRSWDDVDGLWLQVGCFTANCHGSSKPARSRTS
ncbi:substrate-binding domain-containing protein [Mesorhizobium atlanticum]